MTESFILGTYTRSTSKGLYKAIFNPESGQFEKITAIAPLTNPTYVTQISDTRLVSVAQIGDQGGLVVLDEQADGSYKVVSQLGYTGHVPCFVSYDQERGYLLTANYHDGIFSVLSLSENGQLSLLNEAVHQGNGPHKNQDGPHVHYASINPHSTDNYVFVCDLGTDEVITYAIEDDSYNLKKVSTYNPKAGSGPRHLIFHSSLPIAYLLCELSSTVDVLRYHKDGSFERTQTVNLLPDDFTGESSGAAIRLDKSNRHLYASNRGHDSIVIFDTGKDGLSLKKIQTIHTEGKTPRDFNFDQSEQYILSGHQNETYLSLFSRDMESGLLTLLDHSIPVPECVCVLPLV